MRSLVLFAMCIHVASCGASLSGEDRLPPGFDIDEMVNALSLESSVDGDAPLSISDLATEVTEDIEDSYPSPDEDAIDIVIGGDEMPEVTQELMDCATDPGCDDNARAVFWLAADSLAGLGSRRIHPNPAAEVYPELRNWDALHLCLVGELECKGDDADKQVGRRALDALAEREDEIYSMFLKAYELGDCYAPNEIGIFHRDADLGRRQSFAEAATWFRKGMACGDENAHYNLAGLMYHDLVQGTPAEIDDLLKTAYRNGMPELGHIIIAHDAERGTSLAHKISNWHIRASMRVREDRWNTLNDWNAAPIEVPVRR